MLNTASKFCLLPAALGALAWLCGLPAQAAESFDYHSIRRIPRPGTENGVYEGEHHFAPQGNARVQSMRHYGDDWSGDAHFLWDGTVGQSAEVRFQVARKSRYRLTLQFTRAPDYGVFQIALDGKPVASAPGDEAESKPHSIDLYSSRVGLAPIVDLGTLPLDAGMHRLSFRLTGGNERAVKFRGTGYLLGLDYFQLEDQAPPAPVTAEASPPQPPVELLEPVQAQALLRRHCHRCHSGEQPKGELNLAEVDSQREWLGRIDLVERMADVLAFGDMPPEQAEQPSTVERRQLVGFFHGIIDRYAQDSDELEPVVMRRLTRYEYNNAVRDLLALRGDVYPLPERTLRAARPYYDPDRGVLPDVVRVGNRMLGKNQVEKQILEGVSPFALDLQAEHGFNNRGDQLSVPPLLLEVFIELGESIVHSREFPEYCSEYDKWFTGPPEGASPEESIALARERLAALLERAFRRPADSQTLDRYLAFFARQYAQSGSYGDSMKRVVAAVLASPRFLFLNEQSAGLTGHSPLDDYELATRLSFFLWSTIPDQELLELAAQKKLGDPEVLQRQVQRMLRDQRSRALSENFARQWLRLDQLITAVPDIERFPRYYSRIGCEQWKFGLQMMVEPLLLFESVVVEDRSIMLLIDSNYSYRSAELESWYRDETPFGGKENIGRFDTFQQDFVRRPLKSRREGGVITTAATMTMTSSPLRTRPITRGAWVATVILNQPPDPPPDIVPEIEADDAVIESQGITLRERLRLHQTNESCAACHSKIDPLGFMLENYDAVGRWRDSYRSGLAINTQGKLFGELEFDGVEGFKQRLLERPSVFIRAFTEHLLSYALGRKLTPSDKPAIDRIVRSVEADHGRFSTLVLEVVRSRPFRYKSNPGSEEKP